MPTIEELEARGFLVRIEVPLEPYEQEFRRLFALPQVVEWLDHELPMLESDGFVQGAPSPREQAHALFAAFIAGEDLSGGTKMRDWLKLPKPIGPPEYGVWELRTCDIRLFGWFPLRGTFVISTADTAARCKGYGLYMCYRDQAIEDAKRLGITAIEGEYDDVF